jgi:hypothetical protein
MTKQPLGTSIRVLGIKPRWFPKTLARAVILFAVMLLLVACGKNVTAFPTPTMLETQQPSRQEVTEIIIALATSDLAIGLNRISFGIIEKGTGVVQDGDVQVSTFYLDGGSQHELIEHVDAEFRSWPAGTGGVFVIVTNFDKPGDWGLGVTVSSRGVVRKQGSIRIRVKDRSSAPGLGAMVPRSLNKTVADVDRLSQLTTDIDPDPELYGITIAEALETGKPLVVVFATPLYCKTATCGPQLDVVKDIKEKHRDAINFIHVEVYDNPEEIEGDLDRAEISATLLEWGLLSEPWVFVVTEDGKVLFKFEGFVDRQELEAALQAALSS